MAKHDTERAQRLIYAQPRMFFQGVPRRDLDAADIAALSDEEYDALLASGVYRVPDKTEKPEKPTAPEKPADKE